MNLSGRRHLLAAALVLGLAGNAALAAAAAAQSPPESTDTIPGWDAFVDQLRHADSQVLAKLPPRLRDDPQVRQEVGRLLLGSLAARTIAAESADGDHPVFLPSINATLEWGQPNADTTYRTTTITPGGVYRMRGELGTLRMLRLGEFGPSTETGATVIIPLAYHDLKSLRLDKHGRFDVVMSAAKPTDWKGDWWPLNPNTTGLLLRQVASDWAHERDPRISIERLDIDARRPRPPASVLRDHLQKLGTETVNNAAYLVAHVEGLRAKGLINKLGVFDVSKMGGLTGQFYYEGAYELADDEALILEVRPPEKCLYASLLLTNSIYETTDWYNNQSSLNDSQWKLDPDGMLRVVISAKDPGVPNWLDIAGYPAGAVQGRWTECSSQPIPQLRKVAVADVRLLLPQSGAITPDQRQAQLRDRRAAVQERPLW